jgi:GntR family transcriptional regulator
MLGIAESDDVVLLERPGIVRGEPLVFATTHMPHSPAKAILDLDMTDRSYIEVLEELGYRLHRSRRLIEARLPSTPVAHQLSIDSGTPVLVVTGVSWLEDGRPIEYSVDIHRGDRSRFDVESYRRRSGRGRDTRFAYATDPMEQHDGESATRA